MTSDDDIVQFRPKVKPTLERMWAVRDRKDLKSVDKAILLALIMRDGQGGCFPSIQTIADDTGFGLTAVKAALARLDVRGIILRTRRRDADGLHQSTLYTIREKADPLVATGPGVGRETTKGWSRDDQEDNPEDNLEEKKVSAMKNSDGVEVGFQEEVVVTTDPILQIHGRLKEFWMQYFDSEADLAMALLQAEPYLQTKSFNYSPEKMVSSQLARIVSDRRDRDRRYAAAKNQRTEAEANDAKDWWKDKSNGDGK